MSEERGASRSERQDSRPWQDLESKLTVDEARERILLAVAPLPPRESPLLQSLDLVLV
jgi:hypothetical protein